MMNTYVKSFVNTALILSICLHTINCMADNVFVNVTGSINVSTCTVNNGNGIEIDFDNIPVSDIGNEKYNKYITVPVNCPFNTGVPYIKVLGDTLGADGNVLSTTTDNFGIALFQGANLNKKLLLGNGAMSADKFYGYRVGYGVEGYGTADGTISFTAVPYKLGTSEPSAGRFTATATLSFNYL